MVTRMRDKARRVGVCCPDKLGPAHDGILSRQRITTVSNKAGCCPFCPDGSAVRRLSGLLTPFARSRPICRIDLHVVGRVLSRVRSSSSFEIATFVSVLRVVLSRGPGTRKVLVIHEGESIARKANTLLSPGS